MVSVVNRVFCEIMNKIFRVQVTYDNGQTSVAYYLAKTSTGAICEAKSLNRDGVIFEVISDE